MSKLSAQQMSLKNKTGQLNTVRETLRDAQRMLGISDFKDRVHHVSDTGCGKTPAPGHMLSS